MPQIRMLVYTNALQGKDTEFNRWYDQVHVPEILELTQAVAAQRFSLSEAQVGDPEPHRYLAIYEFEVDSKDALESLMASAEKMDPGSAIDQENSKMVFYDELGARVSSPSAT